MRSVEHFVTTLILLRVVWAVGKHKLGIKPRVRRGRTVLEIAAAGVGAWWLGRKHGETIGEAVKSGAEIVVHVPARKPVPKGSYTATRYRSRP